MSNCSGDVRTICGLAVAAAIIVACPARAEDAFCNSIPDLSANAVLALGHVTSASGRVHFVKDAMVQPGCPSGAPACAERAYLVPGDRVVVSTRRDAFICATYINARGGTRAGWLPAGAVANDKAQPVAVADWLGFWFREDETGITMQAGKAGALRIDGVVGGLGPAAAIHVDATPAGDRLSFDNDCKVWMQRVGPWLIISDDYQCGGDGVTFGGVWTRKP